MSFSEFVRLIRDALVVNHGSGHQSIHQADENGQLPVREQNVYGKLGRIPEELSMALLEKGTARLDRLIPENEREDVKLPACLQGIEVVVADGKKLKKVSKRLKVLRGKPGKILGGKLLVALSLRKRMVIAMEADLDGERNDVPLTPGLVARVRGFEEKPILWVVDRQFCDLSLPVRFCERGDHFLIRFGGNMSFHADPLKSKREGTDASGRRYVEEWGHIGAKKERQIYVRRITLFREGEENVAVMTDLLDSEKYPATALLATYLERWGIERVFQQVTEVFELGKLIGSTPRATVFQGALCLLLYNLIQVIRGVVAQAGAKRCEEVSTEKLFTDVHGQMAAWTTMCDPVATLDILPATQEPSDLKVWLKGLLKWKDRWTKSPPKKKRVQKHVKVSSGHDGHTSAWRLILASKGQMPCAQRS
jgi:hypothetical protein